MYKPCVAYLDGNTTVLNRHFWRGVAHLPQSEYQFWCERCGQFYTIKKRHFWGISAFNYGIAVFWKRMYERYH